MPSFTFTSPDGQKYTVNGPDGATQEQAFGMLQQQIGLPKAEAAGEKGMSWGDVGNQALVNAPSSALKFAKDIAQPFMHPVDAAKSLYNVGAGALDMADAATNAAIAPYVEPYLPKSVQGEQLPEANFADRYKHALEIQKQGWGGDEKYPQAVGENLSEKYGGVENIKKSIATDPFGVLGDASTALIGGGSLAARVPGMVGKIGDIVRATGDAINPVMGPAKAVGAVGDEYKRLTKSINAPSTEQLYEAADAAYNDPAIKNLAMKPSAFTQWKDKTIVDLNNEGFNDVLSPKSFGVLEKLSDVPAGGFVSGQTFQTLRRALGKAAGSIDATESATAKAMISSLDDFLGNLPKGSTLRGDPGRVSSALTEARGNYAAAKRSDQIDDALDRANRQAGAANSGMNLDNATRQRVKDILNSAKKRRGFSDEEIAQMEAIVKGSPVENFSRRLGNMLGGGGGLGTTIVGSGGAAVGASSAGPVGAAVGALSPVVGYGFKKLSAAMSQADVKKLQEVIRNRSPLGKQMQSSIGNFGKAQTIANGSPTPKNIARLMLAARNVSTNLLDANINLSPEDIVSSMASNGGTERNSQNARAITIHGPGNQN